MQESSYVHKVTTMHPQFLHCARIPMNLEIKESSTGKMIGNSVHKHGEPEVLLLILTSSGGNKDGINIGWGSSGVLLLGAGSNGGGDGMI